MSIMVILGVAMALAVAGAQEAAQIAKTRSLIARLHELVMQKYESYRYRRLPVAMPVAVPPARGLTPLQAARIRCDVIRQLMRMEMPERWTDVSDPAVRITNPLGGAPIAMERPSVSQAYFAFFNSVNGNAVFKNFPTRYQGAKCLYLLVTMGLEEQDVMENFSEENIADVDGSTCKVFVDAWGKPIHFLRWAPGFVSPLQPPTPPVVPPNTPKPKDQRMPDQTDPTGFYGTPQPDPDPNTATDGIPRNEPIPPAVAPSITNWDTFALYPLIYSGGPDGYPDITTDNTNYVRRGYSLPTGTWNPLVFHYEYDADPPNNPFASISDRNDGNPKANFPLPIGAPTTGDSGADVPQTSDNIHNHSIGAR